MRQAVVAAVTAIVLYTAAAAVWAPKHPHPARFSEPVQPACFPQWTLAVEHFEGCPDARRLRMEST